MEENVKSRKSLKVLKQILLVFTIIISILLLLGVTDYLLSKNKKEPIFCKKGEILWDGGSYECYGFMYKVNVYKNILGEVQKTKFGTWNLEFDKQKTIES